MSDLKLFRVNGSSGAAELVASPFGLEKQLQAIIEQNMEPMFAARFLASEYSTGKLHGGRIDSLGLDENGAPVIFEYKRAMNENVINQGLFYLDWLLDHRAEFDRLVAAKLGAEVVPTVDWRGPRLVCVASGFTRYDEHAVRQINRSIDLVRYRDFGDDLLALELITAVSGSPGHQQSSPVVSHGTAPKTVGDSKTVSQYLEQSPRTLQDLYAAVEGFALALGDDVQKKVLQLYIAFKRIKNFACVEVHPQTQTVLVYLKVPPNSVSLEEGFSRDVSKIGHFGTGDLELRLKTPADLERAQPLIQRSYEGS